MKTILATSGLVLGALGGLLYLAGWRGNVVAGFVLGLLTAALLIGAGFGVSLLQAHIAAKREALRFSQNVKENLAIMERMQRIQNAQNDQLLKQVRQLPERSAPALVIDDGIFSELED
ncbi:MAG: hypothetical protein D6796_17345 [Caldilineae bacterium]|nr:MAG: hypothetical protein D6796_17345 [Caldilineae bacterium]